MLVSSKELLLKAREGHYAIPAANFLDLDNARVFVQTAQKLNKPLIIEFAQVHRNIISLEEAAVVGLYAANSVEVPIVLHLDHGEDADYIKRAIELGFSSVMLDASSDPFDLNVSRTKEIVDLAHAKGISVEAEIGHVGQGANYTSADESDNVYTTVEEAAAFVAQTGVDSLAVSIGTAHGVYKGNGVPKLNFERLQELRNAIEVPLVLHGGSGTGDDNLNRCSKEGICKLNIYTDFGVNAMKQIELDKPANFVALKQSINTGVEKMLEHYYNIFETPSL